MYVFAAAVFMLLNLLFVPAAQSQTVTPPTLPTAYVGVPYSQAFGLTGGFGPYEAYTQIERLPPGLSLDFNTALLSGTPIATGSYSFDVEVYDHGTGQFNIQSYVLAVNLAVPSAPSAVSAVAGNGQVSVAFTAPASNGGTNITGYTVTSNPGGFTGTGTASPIIVTGLANGTAYTFTVTATNSQGTGSASAASAAVTPKAAQTITFNNPGAQNFGTTPTLSASSTSNLTVSLTSSTTGVCTITSGGTLTFVSAGTCTINADQAGNAAYLAATQVSQSFTVNPVIPGAPTIGTATAGDRQASVSFTAPASNGGASITGYTVTSSPGGFTGSGSSSPIAVTGLTNGTAYTFTVTTTNSAGTGAASAASNSVTWALPTLSINDVSNSEGNSGTTTFTFTVTLSAPSAQPVTVNYATANGTAQAGSDYVASSGTLTFSPGQITQMLSVTVYGDTDVEPDETFFVNLSDPSFATLSKPQGVGIILNDDSAAPIITLSPASIANPKVGVAYSQSIAAAGGTAPYTYAISGSLPTGLTFASNGILSGTPTVAGSYNFTVIATDSSTGAGAPFAGSRAYSVTVAAPTLVLSPASGSLPSATVGWAYSQSFTASDGTAPYTYAITSGSVPTGLSLAANGTLSGTPTVAGSYNFTVTTTDSSTGAGAPFTSSHAYSVTVAAGAIPVVSAIAPSSGPSSGGTTVTITGTGFGGATAVTFGASSATGFTVNSATQITATAPAGTGTVDIRVTTAGGTSATSAADQFTYVVAPAIPSLSISDVTQNEGNSGGAAFNFTVTLTSASASAVTVNYATSNGSATAPSDYTATSGALTFAPGQITQTVTVQVNGDTTVEPDETFFVNLSSPFNATLGKSQGVATIVNDDNALSVSAPNKTVSVAAGAEAVVDVVAGATGGPFTAATVVSLAPASAGVATIAGGSGVYSVRFVPAGSFAGVAVVTYTLTNGAVQSAPATVTITVAARVDAAQDAEVAGLATAQASAAQRFTTAQVTNFTQRLESLHGSGWGRSSFGLSLATDDTRKMARNGNGVADQVINGNPLRNGMRTVGLKPQRVAQAQPSPVNDLPDLPGTTTEQARSPWAFWVNGAISYGRERTGDADERYRFTTNGISAGVDYRVNGWITVGTGLGISTDRSRVGNKGTRSNADSTVAVAYASMRPMQGVFVDALLGYGVLSFDSKRYITATGDMATGSRDGKQLFGSIATGLEFYRADWMWSPYARLEFSQAKLDAYTENGPATHALKYFDQTVRSSKAVLGARAEGKMAVRWGHIMPQVRVEYARSFDEQNEAGLAYADLADQGPAYTLRGRAMDIGRWTVGLGGRLLLRSGTELGVEYTTNIDQSNAYVGSLRLGLRVPF
ncbi:autotransporter domain-containing protein [Comamonas aquatica]|nr:autotransporter domain-containing protein [Comamonas aquatica]